MTRHNPVKSFKASSHSDNFYGTGNTGNTESGEPEPMLPNLQRVAEYLHEPVIEVET
jgi:hypothetical protein